jgi:hypothetical protein
MKTALAFDQHQFQGRRQHPVHANFIAGEWRSSGIAFEDYTRFNTQNHKPSAERRLPTPDWAVNDDKLREVLVVYLEHRARAGHKQPGTQAERLARAVAKLRASTPAKIALIKKLNHEYATLKRSDPRHPRLRKLEIQIENLDTQLRLMIRPAEVLIGVVYYYYRARLDSVGTGLALGIKPPAVRQTLRRLRRTWERMGTAPP